MNEQTESNINEAIDWLQQTGGSIQDFATEQAPLYCREVVQWQLWQGIFGVMGAMVLLALSIYSLKNCRKAFAEANKSAFEDEAPAAVGWLFLSVFPGVAGIVLCGIFGSSAIKAAVAPRVVIVEHLRGLSK